jgi:hypothetical protein
MRSVGRAPSPLLTKHQTIVNELVKLRATHVNNYDMKRICLFTGCMNDIRIDGEWLPMETSQNKETIAAHYTSRSQNVHDDCPSSACFNSALYCEPGLACVDLWRHAECR